MRGRDAYRRRAIRAAVRDRYGPPDVLEIREVERPTPGPDEALVRVHAASVNPADWYATVGTPDIGRTQMGLLKPTTNRVGTDFAGVVEAVDENVMELREATRCSEGEPGPSPSTWRPNAVARKPANASRCPIGNRRVGTLG
jgi:NADPH:quinone reductase-like Zn-dependent oxidoreductase